MKIWDYAFGKNKSVDLRGNLAHVLISICGQKLGPISRDVGKGQLHEGGWVRKKRIWECNQGTVSKHIRKETSLITGTLVSVRAQRFEGFAKTQP